MTLMAINLQLEQAKLEVERLQNEIASNKSQVAELEKERKTPIRTLLCHTRPDPFFAERQCQERI